VIKACKTPDLNAPRYRPKKLNLTNIDFYKKFISSNPKYSSMDVSTFKSIISAFNGEIWKKVVEERDGIELPEQLGYLFIGTCPRKKNSIDFSTSAKYGKVIQHQNWESDQYSAKIFYTNFETKYRFKHHEMWGFSAVRDFKRTVAHTYPQEWKKYVMVDNLIKVSRLFRKEKFKDFKKQETQKIIENNEYDEFNLD
jgi:hypothetical protein